MVSKRHAMLNEIEWWVIKCQHENKLSLNELRMSRWMCGNAKEVEL